MEWSSSHLKESARSLLDREITYPVRAADGETRIVESTYRMEDFVRKIIACISTFGLDEFLEEMDDPPVDRLGEQEDSMDRVALLYALRVDDPGKIVGRLEDLCKALGKLRATGRGDFDILKRGAAMLDSLISAEDEAAGMTRETLRSRESASARLDSYLLNSQFTARRNALETLRDGVRRIVSDMGPRHPHQGRG